MCVRLIGGVLAAAFAAVLVMPASASDKVPVRDGVYRPAEMTVDLNPVGLGYGIGVRNGAFGYKPYDLGYGYRSLKRPAYYGYSMYRPSFYGYGYYRARYSPSFYGGYGGTYFNDSFYYRPLNYGYAYYKPRYYGYNAFRPRLYGGGFYKGYGHKYGYGYGMPAYGVCGCPAPVLNSAFGGYLGGPAYVGTYGCGTLYAY
ncbi:hypothetical protein [Stratiformator vulcanicus]|uniref:Uncharacterized protein n=1 Tax=Stratiformator vulcanicus TaxID=2527980 RepID=A0A517QVM4_9PLAN|nr:hypothetical protein [Stratiformator vulcanicus]QDT35658.1 hypothetical protein Pan189_00110 [Stratiformator vulcanicus]